MLQLQLHFNINETYHIVLLLSFIRRFTGHLDLAFACLPHMQQQRKGRREKPKVCKSILIAKWQVFLQLHVTTTSLFYSSSFSTSTRPMAMHVSFQSFTFKINLKYTVILNIAISYNHSDDNIPVFLNLNHGQQNPKSTECCFFTC